ncbi:MAG: hypothetical protein WCK33_02555 [Phycisphaerae bacterium]|jgi:hypothetical protein
MTNPQSRIGPQGAGRPSKPGDGTAPGKPPAPIHRHPAARDELGLTDDSYLTGDNGWPVTGEEANELQREYDALADLFLSEDTDAPAASPLLSAPSPTVSKPTPDAPAPSPASSAPVRVAPIATTACTQRHQPSQGVDCLVVGHLPVLDNPWTLQFARMLAQTTGHAVALLRLRSKAISLEVVYADNDQAVALKAGGPTAHFHDALARARAVAPRLLVRVDETSELELLASSGQDGAARIDHVSLLCGGDEAAVVTAYRTIKQLTGNPALGFGGETDGSSQGRGSDIGVAIIGAEPEAAARAFSKLSRTTQTFLGRTIASLGCIRRMDSCITSTLFRGEWGRSVREMLEQVGDLWHVGPAAATPRAEQAHAIATLAAPASNLPSASSSPRLPAPVAPAPPPSVVATPSTAASPSVAASPAPITTPATLPAASAPISSSDRPTAAMLPGLIPMGIRCPYQPSVELALDAEGGLHLVAMLPERHGPAGPATEAVATLLAASAWASDHADLLCLARRELQAARIKAGPELHLLTEDPRWARHVLSTGIRVHLLAVANTNGRTSWVCTDLN